MLELLIQKIKDTLNEVPAIKAVYDYALDGNPEKFPAAIFFFDRFDNSFDSVSQNLKIVSFKLYLVINTSGTTIENVQGTLMPKLVDTIVSKFDSDWDFGTQDGSRVSALITGGDFSLSTEQKGVQATMDLTLQLKVLTDN